MFRWLVLLKIMKFYAFSTIKSYGHLLFWGKKSSGLRWNLLVWKKNLMVLRVVQVGRSGVDFGRSQIYAFQITKNVDIKYGFFDKKKTAFLTYCILLYPLQAGWLWRTGDVHQTVPLTRYVQWIFLTKLTYVREPVN